MRVHRLFKLGLFLIMATAGFLEAQESDVPFRELSEYPEAYTENSVAARMIESLGFRYYWASHALTDSDLEYSIGADARTIKATLAHIYDLSVIIRNSAENKVNRRDQVFEMNYQDQREATLKNLKIAVDIINKAKDMEGFEIKFDSGSYPFWNQINGPVSDAIWHCGQLATLRRANGNPINPKVNHFLGNLRN